MQKFYFILFSILFFSFYGNAQVSNRDTFFLAKKKGILGKLGKSISRNPVTQPVKIVNPYKQHIGKVIRNIEVQPLSFNENIYDTNIVKNNIAIKIANFLHKNTKVQVVRNNLFFREGDKVLPLLIADNERYLRDLSFFQDARIIIFGSTESPDSVDILVLTKDVFSIGGKASVSNLDRARVELKEDNIHGSGSSIALRGLYDKDRDPLFGYGAVFTRRNIKGSFLDWSTGFETFRNAFNNGRREELNIFTRVERPFMSRFTQWTGALELSYNKNNNNYNDTLFKTLYKYSNHQADIWAGYNLFYKRARRSDAEGRFRHLIAGRGFYTRFSHVPDAVRGQFSTSYVNINGGLASYTLYKQNFYRTNFIYGFGRNEDVPVGVSASVIGGWTNKENRKRAYYGLDFEGNYFSKKGYFTSGKVRVGTYAYKKEFEDIGILISGEHFTRLRTLGGNWLNRNFVSASYTRLAKLQLNDTLTLKSSFGLPYFRQNDLGDMRATLKLESVFFNLYKVLGFRFAPFAFTEFCFLKPVKQPVGKTNGYTAIGGGVRTRNENLVFGTTEFKFYYFPRTIGDMKGYRFEVGTNLRFRFNSTFVKRPEFVVTN